MAENELYRKQSVECRAAVTRRYVMLETDVDVINTDLLSWLFQEGVINMQEKDRVMAGETRTDRTRRLLDIILKKKRPGTTRKFLQGLQRDHSWIVNDVNKDFTSSDVTSKRYVTSGVTSPRVIPDITEGEENRVYGEDALRVLVERKGHNTRLTWIVPEETETKHTDNDSSTLCMKVVRSPEEHEEEYSSILNSSYKESGATFRKYVDLGIDQVDLEVKTSVPENAVERLETSVLGPIIGSEREAGEQPQQQPAHSCIPRAKTASPSAEFMPNQRQFVPEKQEVRQDNPMEEFPEHELHGEYREEDDLILRDSGRYSCDMDTFTTEENNLSLLSIAHAVSHQDAIKENSLSLPPGNKDHVVNRQNAIDRQDAIDHAIDHQDALDHAINHANDRQDSLCSKCQRERRSLLERTDTRPENEEYCTCKLKRNANDRDGIRVSREKAIQMVQTLKGSSLSKVCTSWETTNSTEGSTG